MPEAALQWPAPEVSELGRPFWEAARAGRLVRPVCVNGHNFFPPQVLCPHCLSSDWRWTESSGEGTIYSFTTVYRSPAPEFDAPYVVAIIDLVEGWSMLGNIVRDDPPRVVIGAPVRVTWRSTAGDAVVPVFEIAEPTR